MEPPEPPSSQPNESRATRWARRVGTIALFAAPVLPLCGGIWLLIAAGLPDFALDGDGALIELRIRNAAAGQQLLGSYSRFGFDHPGPLHFYLCVPAYLASGGSATSLNLTTLLLHTVTTLGTLGVALRAGGLASLLAGSLVLTAYFGSLGPVLLTAWDPSMAITPTILCFVACAGFVTGVNGALAVAALAGSFAVQAHLSLAPSVAAALCGAVVLRCVLRSPSRPRTPPWRSIGLAAGIGLLSASLPLFEQLSGDPGNVTRIVTALGARAPHLPWSEAATITAERLGSFATTTIGVASPAAAWIATAVQLVCLGLCAAVGPRRPALAALAWIGLGLHGVAFVAIKRIVGDVQPHMLVWVASIGVLAWWTITAAAVAAAVARPRRWIPVAGCAVAAVLAVTCWRATERLLVATLTFVADPAAAARTPDLGGAADELAAILRREGIDRVAVDTVGPPTDDVPNSTFVTAAGVVLALEKRGIAAVPAAPRLAFAYPRLHDPDRGTARTVLLFGPLDRRRLDRQRPFAHVVDRAVWGIAVRAR